MTTTKRRGWLVTIIIGAVAVALVGAVIVFSQVKGWVPPVIPGIHKSTTEPVSKVPSGTPNVSQISLSGSGFKRLA
jgi:hypothetical protein